MGAKDDFVNIPLDGRGFLSVSVQSPLMTRELFAEIIGLPLSVLIAQCEKGYWAQIHVGKRVFINLELVRKQCLEKEFSI
jgi:hypothetical protein